MVVLFTVNSKEEIESFLEKSDLQFLINNPPIVRGLSVACESRYIDRAKDTCIEDIADWNERNDHVAEYVIMDIPRY